MQEGGREGKNAKAMGGSLPDIKRVASRTTTSMAWLVCESDWTCGKTIKSGRKPGMSK